MANFCGECGSQIPSAVKFCPECGRATATAIARAPASLSTSVDTASPPASPVPGIAREESHPLACPACREVDQVKRVSSVVSQGAASVSLSGGSTASIERPLLQGSGRIGTAYTATGLSGGIHTLQSGHVMAAFCTNLRAPMGVYHYATPDLHPLVRGSGHHSVSTSWTRAMRRWEQLHYCQRCNGVFIPSESPLVPVPQMRNFLYRPPASPVARAASR